MTRAFAFLGLLALAAAGCLGAPTTDSTPAGPRSVNTDLADLKDLTYTFTGTIASATPATPAGEDFPFEVPKGATAVAATLRWEGATSSLTLSLVNPRGEVEETGFTEKPGQRSAATVEPPASGEWKARVGSTRAVNQAFTLDVVVTLLSPKHNLLENSLPMNPGTFAELNLIMEEKAAINWSFESSAGQPIRWNIHTHENGETKILESGTDASRHAAFTASKRQIYSILFENVGPATTLAYRVEGAFRVHSHSQ